MKPVVRRLAEFVNGKGTKLSSLIGLHLPTRASAVQIMQEVTGVILFAKFAQATTAIPALVSGYAKVVHGGLTFTFTRTDVGTYNLGITKTTGVEVNDITFDATKVIVEFQEFSSAYRLNVGTIAVASSTLNIPFTCKAGDGSGGEELADVFTSFIKVTLL